MMTSTQLKFIAVEKFNGIGYMYKDALMAVVDQILHQNRLPAKDYPQIKEAVIVGVQIHFPNVAEVIVRKMFEELEIQRAENVKRHLNSMVEYNHLRPEGWRSYWGVEK